MKLGTDVELRAELLLSGPRSKTPGMQHLLQSRELVKHENEKEILAICYIFVYLSKTLYVTAT